VFSEEDVAAALPLLLRRFSRGGVLAPV